MNLLALHELTVRCDNRVVLDNISLSVATGELVGVVGANGAGKTTLLRAALGLARSATGRVELAGRDLSRMTEMDRAQLAAYLPQERHVGWNMSAWRIAGLGAFDQPPAQARAAAWTALARVGLQGLEDRGVLQMSGVSAPGCFWRACWSHPRPCWSPTNRPRASIPTPSCWRWTSFARRLRAVLLPS